MPYVSTVRICKNKNNIFCPESQEKRNPELKKAAKLRLEHLARILGIPSMEVIFDCDQFKDSMRTIRAKFFVNRTLF